MNPPPVPPPQPFGDPVRVRDENAQAVRKGLLFGCGGCAVIGACLVAFVFGILAIVFGSLRNSDVCNETFARAQASSEARAALGKPMELGWVITGSVKTFNEQGNADLWIPISGPNEPGSVHVVAKKVDGLWIYSLMTLVTEKTHRRINLLPEPAS